MKKNFYYFFVVSSLLLASCSHKSNSKDAPSKTENPGLKQVETVNQVIGIGLIVPEALITDLAAQLPGTVTEIYQNIGDSVKAGEIILQMDDRDEQLALQKLKQQKQTQIFQITEAQAQLDEKKVQLENQKAKLKSSIELQKSGAETLQNLEDLQSNVLASEAGLQALEANLDLVKSQLNPIEVDINQAILNIDKKNVRAPTDGIILQIDVANHSSVNQYQTVVTFAPKGNIIAKCEIDELFANQVKLGQAADVRYIGFSEVIATGKVILMSPYLSPKSLFVQNATDQQDRRVREVQIQLDNPQSILFNSRVEVTIKTK